jgi:23S rRNA (adenine2503-C2)-methyltransferase
MPMMTPAAGPRDEHLPIDPSPDDALPGTAPPGTAPPGAEAPGAALTGVALRPVPDPRPAVAGLPVESLAAWFASAGAEAYRVEQFGEAFWRRHARSASEMRGLPTELRRRIDAAYRLDTLNATDVRPADGGLTLKALHTLADGALIESVLMRYPARTGRRERSTVCISSQVGCAVGCPFCATGELGFGRDLSTAEIVDQVRWAARSLAVGGRRLTNVVFMGMGEPLLNLDRVLDAVGALADPDRFGLGARHVTVSTSGVVPGIRRLTALGPQFTLAVSLHAARDSLRDVLVPLNRRWPVAEVVAAAGEHARATGRRISYEYTMIAGINDTAVDAEALAALLRGALAHINLIPMNPVAHTPWTASPMATIEAFAARLGTAGIPVTIRRNRGQEIGAACGQLAAEHAGEPAAPVVARRRDRLVAASAAALRGERSLEPTPSGLGPADGARERGA